MLDLLHCVKVATLLLEFHFGQRSFALNVLPQTPQHSAVKLSVDSLIQGNGVTVYDVEEKDRYSGFSSGLETADHSEDCCLVSGS